MQNRYFKYLLGIFTLLSIIIYLLNFNSYISPNKKVITPTTSVKDSPKNPEELFYELLNTFNHTNPGYGKADYGQNEKMHIAKSYAMFLSATLLNKDNYSAQTYNSWISASGLWLLNNSDRNNNGIIGWGVPVSWDAFGDGSINEKNTEYTISTAIVVKSLLDWIEIDSNAPKNKIIALIEQALQPYVEEDIFTSSELYNYSLKAQDRDYDCFNPAAFMMGQILRFSKFTKDNNLQSKLVNSADRVAKSLLNSYKIDGSDTWYWNYSLQEDVPNDLCHAAYIVHGIFTYIKHSGNLADQFDFKRIYSHLNTFKNKSGEWQFLPRSIVNRDLPPRSYGIGMLLSLFSQLDLDSSRADSLISTLQKYQLDIGIYSRWQGESISINEYQSYLLYGLSSYLNCKNAKQWRTNSSWSTSDITTNKLKSKIKKSKNKIVPIKLAYIYDKSNIEIFFNKDDYSSTIAFNNGHDKNIKIHGIPLKIHSLPPERLIILYRKIFSNKLEVLLTKTDTYSSKIIKIDTSKNSFFDYQQSVIINNNLYLVCYDSPSRQNVLYEYSINDDSIELIHHITLPSFKDPAGDTYNSIPNVSILNNNQKGVYIVAGGTVTTYFNKQLHTLNLPLQCETILESKIIHGELHLLFRTYNKNYVLFNVFTNSIVLESKKDEIIIDIEHPKIVNKHSSSTELSKIVMDDFLNTKAGGIAYLGTNNLEGWSAWNQIYYLNGLIDILWLSNSNNLFFDAFSSYLLDVKERLDLEMYLLDQLIVSSTYGLKCRSFTVDRSPTIFAVQSSRFLTLFSRYNKLTPDPIDFKSLDYLKNSVANLTNHIEVLVQDFSAVAYTDSGENGWPFIMWPKNSKFKFDGLPVPYNHQNEWATAILKTSDDENIKTIAADIINWFIVNETDSDGLLPLNGIWRYWWGKAYTGWDESENISSNSPSYPGDKGMGWISFRTIDAASVLAKKQVYPEQVSSSLVERVMNLVYNGKLYPWISEDLFEMGLYPKMDDNVVAKYYRVNSPWELQNSVWATLQWVLNQ